MFQSEKSSQEQAHLLFPIDCNCMLCERGPIGIYNTYRHVLVVVELSSSYMAPIELDYVIKIIIPSPEQAHLLFPIDCNCKL